MAGNWRRGGSIELRVYVGRDPLTNRKRYETKTIPLVGKREADREWALFVAEVGGSGAPTIRRRTRQFGRSPHPQSAARTGPSQRAAKYALFSWRLRSTVRAPLRSLLP